MRIQNREIKNFVNPTGYWEYDGPFSVELTNDADKSIAPPSVQIKRDTATVTNGRIKQSRGGIQLYSEGQPFYWGNKFLKVIRDGKGNLLWVNYQYRRKLVH